MTTDRLAAHIVRTLIGAGVHDVVISPGSRSGPLALQLLSAERDGALRIHVRIDERSAAFLALGIAKAAKRPAVVLTTSGTAVANLHPALLEAKHSGVPLIALTADRPARLRGTGANQTTIQPDIFPGIPCLNITAPDELPALHIAGPMQVNVELDEPLFSGTTPPSYRTAPTTSATQIAGGKSMTLEADSATVIVAGDGASGHALELAAAGGWPVFAEPSSGARSGEHSLRTYRLLLQHAPLASQIRRVITLGHPTLSRPVTKLLNRYDLDILVVGADLTQFPAPAGAARLVERIAVTGQTNPAWLAEWQRADTAASQAIDAYIEHLSKPNPFEIARCIAQATSNYELLYVGSSSPIRDLDLMAEPWRSPFPVLASRGLAGIDGAVSTAMGAALALSGGRSLAYLGDLTFLHDSNGLILGPDELEPDLTIVVASDNGGAIFSVLEQGAEQYADSFERLFGTPTRTDIGQLCAAHQIPHTVSGSVEELRVQLHTEFQGVRVIEIPLERAERRDWNAGIGAAVQAALRECF